MAQTSLHLFETNLNAIDGTAPETIDLTHYTNKQSTSIVIGRGSPAYPSDIVLNARKDGREIISRNHAKLTFTRENGWIIHDLGAINGIFVNRKRVQNTNLNNGDVIQLGGISNVPVGQLMKESDLCIKYRFSCNINNTKELKNVAIKKKREINNSKELPTPAKKKRNTNSNTNKDKDDDCELNKAHEAMNQIFANKDIEIANLTKSLLTAQNESKTSISKYKTRINNLEVKLQEHIQQTELLEESNRILQCDLKESKSHCLDYKARFDQCKARYENEKLSSISSTKISTKISTLTSSEQKIKKNSSVAVCAITTCIIEASLSCLLCKNILNNPVVLTCSHGFCRTCIKKEIKHQINDEILPNCPFCCETLSKYSTVNTINKNDNMCLDEYFTQSNHLNAMVTLVNDSSI
jgi:pSer/pThr/pTyr-binding forkhead associated (FHA) protein